MFLLKVRGYSFSKTRITPVENPKIIALSKDALKLIDINIEDVL